MKYFDLHCDTLYELHKKDCRLDNNRLCHISLDRADFEEYSQVFAVWSDKALTDDEAYSRFFEIVSKTPVLSMKKAGFTPYLAVEGANLLGGDISRLDALFEAGVRILTLTWSGISVIGGAWDTDTGLTAFGREVLEKCFSLGIIPDVSHSSDTMFYEVAEYKRPFIASHSDCRAVNNHRRNLTDDMIKTVVAAHGLCGITLTPYHLAEKTADTGDILRHIQHYLSLGAQDSLCFGCDFDGVEYLPSDIGGIGDIHKIRDALISNRIEERICDKIFFNNANEFFKRNIK